MAQSKMAESPAGRSELDRGPRLAPGAADAAVRSEFDDLDIRLLEVSVAPFGYATDDNCGSTCGGTACASGPS